MYGKLLSIYASRGGVGKTLLAVNLAVNLHLETRDRVLLLDFARPYSFDVAAMLNLARVNALESVLPNAARLSPAMLKTYVTTHDSGVDVLALTPARKPAAPDALQPQRLRTALDRLLQAYAYVLADCGSVYDPATACLLDLSSLILLPVTPDYLALQHTAGDLAMLQADNFARELVKPVCNCAGRNEDLAPQDMERSLGRPLFGSIAFDPAAQKNLGGGRTYPRDWPRLDIAKDFDTLTGQVIRSAVARQPQSEAAPEPDAASGDSPAELDRLKQAVHQKLLETFDLKHADLRSENDPEKLRELEQEVTTQIVSILDEETTLLSRELRASIVREVLRGFLPLK